MWFDIHHSWKGPVDQDGIHLSIHPPLQAGSTLTWLPTSQTVFMKVGEDSQRL